MSGSAYLDAIAAAYPPAYAGPAGNQAVTPGTIASYADVYALIQAATDAAGQYMYDGSAYATAYASHVMDAVRAARAAVVRANGKARGVLGSDAGAIDDMLATADVAIGSYGQAIAAAVLQRQPVVYLPTHDDWVRDVSFDTSNPFASGLGIENATLVANGAPVAGNFRDTLVWYLGILRGDLADLQAHEAAEVILGNGGVFGLLGDALGLVVDAIRGVWNVTKALAAATIAGVNIVAQLIAVAPYAALGVGGWYVAKKVGLIGGAKAA
jgi:hypothetical protein